MLESALREAPSLNPIVELRNVSKVYNLNKVKVPALQNVNMVINSGEFIAITGESGSGKSTLLQLIGCVDKPTSGDVIIGGQGVARLRDSALSELRCSAIGFVFQSFYLQPFLRLMDNIGVPAMFKGGKKQDIDQKASLLLEQVGLSDRKQHYPKELSGGQIQRAAIARALMNNPKIILADEPTGNLDSVNSSAVIALFHDIRKRYGTTIIVVTHSAEIATQADRVITLKDGSIV